MKKPLSELTVDELKTRQKSLKTSFAVLIGLMIVLVASLVALIMLKSSRSMVISLSVFPVIFLPALINSKRAQKDVEAELASRVRA